MESEKYNCHFLPIPEIGALIRAELSSGEVRVITGKVVQRISQDEDELRVHTDISETEAANMLLVAAGARLDADLAQTAGIGICAGKVISVDRTMAMQVPGIWAMGGSMQAAAMAWCESRGKQHRFE